MRRHQAPRLALALLERVVPDSASLAGDLIEEFERRQSSAWLWRQVLAAIVSASFEKSDDIRPLRLVDLQPADALERSRKMNLRFRPVNLSASPLSAVGGLGLVALAFLVTIVAPWAWWAVPACTVGGVLLGLAIIAMHRPSPTPVSTIRPHSAAR
jgi:hypothetical protein